MARLFAIGDIHGCFIPFYKLLTDTIAIRKEDRLILLGDYIDRGSRSKEVIDFIIELIETGFNVTPLMGNHEAMLLESYADPGLLYQWYMNSGETTLKSFGIDDVRDLPERYLEFLSGLKFHESIGNFLFVHAGFNDDDPDPFADTDNMIWESRLVYYNPVLKGKTIIHGHRPKTPEYVEQQLRNRSNVMPIDTGCVYGTETGYGYLSALEVNQMKLYSVLNDQ